VHRLQDSEKLLLRQKANGSKDGIPIPIHCVSGPLEFEGFDGHKVVAGFDGERSPSGAGALLLGHIDAAIGLFDRVETQT
jgi:hypothetical protein